MMINSSFPNIPLWGSRKYLQGGHLLQYLIDSSEAWNIYNINRIVASYRSPARSKIVYELYDSSLGVPRERKKYCASFSIFTESMQYFCVAIETGEPIRYSIGDDEAELIANAKIFSDIAAIEDYPPGKILNVIIALTKKHNTENFNRSKYYNWKLAKLDINIKSLYKKYPAKIQIIRKRAIANKMTLSKVILSGIEVGTIYFDRKIKNDRN